MSQALKKRKLEYDNVYEEAKIKEKKAIELRKLANKLRKLANDIRASLFTGRTRSSKIKEEEANLAEKKAKVAEDEAKEAEAEAEAAKAKAEAEAAKEKAEQAQAEAQSQVQAAQAQAQVADLAIQQANLEKTKAEIISENARSLIRQAQAQVRQAQEQASLAQEQARLPIRNKINIKLRLLATTSEKVNALFKIEKDLAIEGYDTKSGYISEVFNRMYPYGTEDDLRDFLFKIDSIHDFTKERGDKELNDTIIESLGFDLENEYDKKMVHDDDLETSIFFWLINKLQDRRNNMDFRESIQFFYEDKVQYGLDTSYNFTIDAGLKEYNIFYKYFSSITTLERKQVYTIRENEIINELIKEFNNAKDEFQYRDKNDPEYYILYSFGQNLTYAYNIINELVKINIIGKNIWEYIFDKYTKEDFRVNYNHRLKTYLENIKYKIPIEQKDVNTPLGIYKEYMNTLDKQYKDKTNFKITKLDFKKNIEISATRQREINKFIQKSESFKVIAPQKFDANRSTGGSEVSSNILHLSNCINNTIIKDNCSFNILDDTCYFYTIDNNYIFEFSTDVGEATNYPITKIVIVTKEKLISYTQKDFINIERFKYKDKTLYCDAAPGVSELINLYYYFSSKNFEEYYILKNILQIKRAGDYSQIWFCKKWNDEVESKPNPKPSKLFFMSNDRQSASFCVLEKVPYIGQVGSYNFYYNPFMNIQTSHLEQTLSTIKQGVGPIKTILATNTRNLLYSYDTVKDKNNQVADYILNYINIIYIYSEIANITSNDMKNIVIMSDILSNISDIITNDDYSEYILEKDVVYKLNKLLSDLINVDEESMVEDGGNESYKNIIKEIYDYIIKITNDDDIKIEYINDILKEINKPLIPEIINIETEIDYTEEERILSQANIQKISYPTVKSDMAKLAELVNSLSNTLIYCDIQYRIFEATNMYYRMLKKIKKYGGDISIINETEKEEYNKTVNRLFNCIRSSDGEESIKIKIWDILTGKMQSSSVSFSFDNDTPRELIAFSFQKGLTYYNIKSNIPSTINMNKYNNANQVYIMDNKGFMKINTTNKNSKVHINDKSKTCTKEYPDGTKITYFKY